MTNESMRAFMEDIKRLNDAIAKIALADEGKYNYFLEKIESIREEMSRIEDSKYDYNSQAEFAYKIQNLEDEIGQYMNGTITKIELVTEIPEIDSGKKKIRDYRINLYKSIAETMKKQEKIDIQQLIMLRKKWNEEKEGELAYNPIEMEMVDEIFADLLVEFEIRYIRENKKIAQLVIEEICSKETAVNIIKKRLLEAIKGMDKGDVQRLKLEELFTLKSSEELALNKDVWVAISGIAIKDEKQMEAQSETKTSTELIVTKKPIKEKLKIILLDNTIKYIPLTKDGKIKIPEKYISKITGATVPEGIEIIEAETKYDWLGRKYNTSFCDCDSLERIKLPKSLKIIGNKAFKGCTSLESIEIPAECVEIGREAFSCCYGLGKVDILAQMENSIKISDFAFYRCSHLWQINNFGAISYIGQSAFEDCVVLGSEKNFSFAFSKDLKFIGSKAFCSTGIKETIIPNVPRGRGIFKDCMKLKSVEFENGVECVKEEEFEDCLELRRIVCPKTLHTIEGNAFRGCNILNTENIMIGKNGISFLVKNGKIRVWGINQNNIADELKKGKSVTIEFIKKDKRKDESEKREKEKEEETDYEDSSSDR